MDFSDIDFSSVEMDSKNVYLYFSSFIDNKIEGVEELKEIQFKRYAKKHNRDIAEILNLYDIGFKEGIKIAENSIIEKNKISSEGVKFYLFEIASTSNLTAEYYNESINIHFREYTDLDYDPEIVKTIGRIIGKYYFSWVKVLENHRVFEPLFKPEIDRIKNTFPNKPMFPCHNAKILGLPSTMQISKDFKTTLDRLNEVLEIRSDELLKGTIDELNLSWIFRYDIISDLKNQCYEFIQETTDNMNNGIFEKYITDYSYLRNDLINCIERLEALKPIFEMDMSFIHEYTSHKKNWFVIVFDCLINTKEVFDKITGTTINPQPIVNIPILNDNTKLKEQAQNILIALSGRWINKKKIMTDEEYIKVIEGINYLIDNEQVKLMDKKINASAPMQFIRKLFREVNTKLYGKGIKDCIIEFLHVYFECFGDSEVQTTKKHFNEYRNSIYDADYKDVMETIGK